MATPSKNGTNKHNTKGKPRKGPPKGNRNNLRHGLRAGQLPLKCKYIQNQCDNIRRQLEDAVLALRGEITILDAACIQTCVKWERHGALALRWLRLEGETLKPSDRILFSREVARASSERDKALKDLGLDQAPETIDLATYMENKQ